MVRFIWKRWPFIIEATGINDIAEEGRGQKSRGP